MPSRRRILAAIPPILAGCASSPPVDQYTRTPTVTPPETIDECRTAPDAPPEPTAVEATAFVAETEEVRIHNWLVAQHEGPDECRPEGPGSSVSSAGTGGPTDVRVEPAVTTVVTETDAGYYVLSSCSGRAEYWCQNEGRACSSAERNSRFVTHFVADERHERIPHNWFVCHVCDEPYRAPGSDANVSLPAEEPGLTFRIYAFHEDAGADVTLTHRETDERVLEERYSPNVGPAVQANATVATGAYELVAETGEDQVVHEFSLTGRDDPAWNGISVYVGPEDLHVVELATDGDLAVPDSTCYDHRNRESTSGDDGA